MPYDVCTGHRRAVPYDVSTGRVPYHTFEQKKLDTFAKEEREVEAP